MPQQPNILLVMADQLVPFLTGAYGHPLVRTPNLDYSPVFDAKTQYVR